MRVLIVDDTASDRKFLRYNFERHGHEVVEASEGVEGLAKARERRPDLIVSDALMPKKDGFQFLREIKKDESLKNVPFIFYSAVYTGDRDVELAASLGADAFIVKPLEPDALWKEVTAVLAKTRLGDGPPAISASQEVDEEYLRKYSHVVATKLEEKVRELESALMQLRDSTEALRESEERYRSLFDNSGDAILLTIPDGTILEANKAACELFGMTQEEICKAQRHDLVDADSPHMQDLVEEREQTGRTKGTLSFVRRDGSKFLGDFSSAVFRDRKGTLRSCVIIRDITARKKAEERIEGQLRKLSALRTIDLAISSSLDLRVTLDVFAGEAVRQLNVDAANVLLLNHRTNALEFAAGHGFRTTALRHSHLRLGEGYAGKAALQNEIIRIPDLRMEDNAFRRLGLLEGEDFVSYFGVPLVAKGHVKGVLEIFHRSALEPDEEWSDFLEALALQGAIAIDNNSLYYELERSNMDLILAYESTIEGWSRALDYRDKETEGHSQRVTELTLRIARLMGMTEEELVHVRRGALLHDIGKMGIPDNILLKPGPLTEEEWQTMRRHPVYSRELLHPIIYLRPALDIPYCHHEKWDGTGYPRGLKGEEIPLSARIFAVVDVWDALRSDRPYRPAWAADKTIAHMRGLSGTHFDPRVLDVFLGFRESERPHT
jgi:PAS domain S-box-containing protein